MCPLLFVRLSVCPSRICMCAPTSLSGFGSSYGNGYGYDYDYDCDSCYGPVSCHDSVSACSRPNCCMAQISAVQPPALLLLAFSAWLLFVCAHIFQVLPQKLIYVTAAKRLFPLPQHADSRSHRVPCPAPAPASTGLPLSLVLVSSAFSQCTLPCLSTGWCWFVNLKSGSRAKFLHFLAHWKLGYIFTRFIG